MPHYGERLRGESILEEMRRKEARYVGERASKLVRVTNHLGDEEFIHIDNIGLAEHAQPVTIQHHGRGNAHHSGKGRIV